MKKLNEKKVLYAMACKYAPNTGVYFKVDGFCQAAQNLGYVTELVSIECKKLGDFKPFWKKIVKSDAKYIMLRDIPGWRIISGYKCFVKCRRQGKVLICDIPTPNNAESLIFLRTKKISDFRRSIYTVLRGPVPYWFFNTLIQYGNESWYYLLGNRRRTVMPGNGIGKDRIQLRRKEYLDHPDELHILGVAVLCDYHGFDRIVKAIYEWHQNHSSPIFFHIVSGDRPNVEVDKMKQYVVNHNIQEFVIFHGGKTTAQIYDLYGKCDLAVGSLGLFRVGLKSASTLKLREYCLAGIPFVYSGIDSDFPLSLPFCFNVSNDESVDSIINVFEEFSEKRKLFTDEDIRQYALDHLVYEAKLKKIGL